MEYELPWGSTHPGLLIYLVDLSHSMMWGEKIERVSRIIWNVVDCLLAPCQNNGTYINRFHLEVLGYNTSLHPLFSGDVHAMNEWLDAHEDELFFDPEKEGRPQGMTHVWEAFDRARVLIDEWMKRQREQGIPMPAPIVIHVTDGLPEGVGLDRSVAIEKAVKAAEALQALSVPDGHVLLFNIHVSKCPEKEQELWFPAVRPDGLQRRFLYDCSSEMSDEFVTRAQRAGLPAVAGSRFMVSNVADARSLARLVLFGSSVSGMPTMDHRIDIEPGV